MVRTGYGHLLAWHGWAQEPAEILTFEIAGLIFRCIGVRDILGENLLTLGQPTHALVHHLEDRNIA